MASKINKNIDTDLTAEMDQDDVNLLKQARQRFKDTLTDWTDIRNDAVADQKWFKGQQAEAKASRGRGAQPNVQVNMLPNFVLQVENSIRQQNIGITVHATDEEGSEETAKLLQGLIRHIEHQSQATTAYLWAAGSHGALVPGFGFIKLETAYCPDKKGLPTFDQEIYIRGVKDSMSILPDFYAQQPDFSDADFWFEFETMSKALFQERYANSLLSGRTGKNWAQWSTVVGAQWIDPNSVRVARYWYRVPTVRHWALFEDGTQGFLDDFGADLDGKGELIIVDRELADSSFPKIATDPMDAAVIERVVEATRDPGAPADEYPVTNSMVPVDRLAEVVRTREVTSYEVKNILTNGVEILERGEWNDSEFPFVAVIGQDLTVDGKRDIHGIIRYAKDPQKMVNFLTSQVVRRVDAANKSAWIASMESIPDSQRKYWDNSNQENRATLYYQQYDDQGRQLAPPTRGDAIEPAVQQLMAGASMFQNNIKATVGIYDAGLGQAAGERQSGAAIQTLAERGDNANFHVSDNLVTSIKRLGTLILRLIPKIYDTARTVRLVGLDDDAELVAINQLYSDGGETKLYDVKNAGNYDVVVDTGPTFATKKQQMVDSMLKFAAIEPNMMPFLADLLAKNMDWDTTGAVAERIQLIQSQMYPWLHPQDGQKPLPPQAQAQIMQLTKQLQSTQQAAQQLQQLYAVEKYKNDTQVVAHQSKEKQIQLQGFYTLQKQRIQLMAQVSKERNQFALQAAKAELDHVNTRIAHTLQALGIATDAMPDMGDDGTGQVPQLPAPASVN